MFDILFSLIDTVINNNIATMVIRFMLVVKPLIAALVVLYAIYLAYESLFDSQNMMIMESIKFLGSLALVATLAFSIPWYIGKIVPIVVNSGDSVVNALLNPQGEGTAGALQLMFNKILLQIEALYDSIDVSITSGSSIVHAFYTIWYIAVLVISSMPFMAVATAYLVVAKIMISFLLIIGPLFIMFSFFPSTRDFFKSWTGQAFNYFLLNILFPIAFSMFSAILDVTIFANNITFGSIYSSLILFFLMTFVAIQIPTFTSTLSGGIGINGLVGTIASSVGTTARIIKGNGKKRDKAPSVKGNSIAAG